MKKLREYLPFIFVILFGVGILGFQIPDLRPLFLSIVPAFLLLTLILLLYGHAIWSRKFGLWLIFVFFFGWTVEWIGVSSTLIFGTYEYGETLGPGMDNIPWIIGVNWLLLAYCCKDIAARIFVHPAFQIIFASLLMVILDVLIEPVAIKFDFWRWPGDVIPFKNYLGWFGISLLLFTITHYFRLHWENRSSVIVYLCLLAFFASLGF